LSSFIHGFRRFTFVNCRKSSVPVLAGMMNMHVHSKVQRAAECTGITSAMWMTDAAKLILHEVELGRSGKVPHAIDRSPEYDCTCGHYFYRTWKDVWSSATNVYAHVTCLERTILHTNGGRTTQYSLDYLLSEPKANSKVFLAIDDQSKAKGKVIQAPAGLGMGWDFSVLAEERPYEEVLAEVSLSLGVPILDKDSLLGCPICLTVNSWRKSEEITDQMKKDWFGLGYSG